MTEPLYHLIRANRIYFFYPAEFDDGEGDWREDYEFPLRGMSFTRRQVETLMEKLAKLSDREQDNLLTVVRIFDGEVLSDREAAEYSATLDGMVQVPAVDDGDYDLFDRPIPHESD